jgi:hypothetical protein
MAWISTDEYAAHRGVSRRAVGKAIRSGRLTAASVKREGKNWKVQQEIADQEWAANTMQSTLTPPGPSAPSVAPPPEEKAPRVAPSPALTAPSQSQPASPPAPANLGQSQAAAVRTLYQAKLLELDFKQRQGDLVSATEIDRVWFEEIRRGRDRMRRVPLQAIGDISAAVGGMTEPQRAQILLVLERHIVTALEDLAVED